MGGKAGDPRGGRSVDIQPKTMSLCEHFLIGYLKSDMDEIFHCLVDRKGEEKSWCLWFPPVLVK